MYAFCQRFTLTLTGILFALSLSGAGPFHGEWSSNFGTLKLVQQGDRVFGDYRDLGSLEGVYDARTKVLRGTFDNKGDLGVFEFRLVSGNRFTGTWGWGHQLGNGQWNGTRTTGNVSELQFDPHFWTGIWGKGGEKHFALQQWGNQVTGTYLQSGRVTATVDAARKKISGQISMGGINRTFSLVMDSDGLGGLCTITFTNGGKNLTDQLIRDVRPLVADAIDAAVRDEMEDKSLDAVAVGAIRDNRTVYTRGYGSYNGTAVNERTVLPWASISKVLTAVAVHQLIEAGDVRLSDKIVQHVPYYADYSFTFLTLKVPDSERKKQISVEQLLSHRSGMTHNDYSSFPYQQDADGFNAPNAVALFVLKNLEYPPGDTHRYSTSAYTLLGAAVEAHGGFTNRVNRHICQRLGMTTLTISDEYEGKLPGGGYMGSIQDLTRLADGLLKGKLLQRTARLYEGTYPNNGGYKRGVKSGGANAGFYFGHGGSQPGVKSELRVYPNADDAVTVVIRDDNQDGNDRYSIVNRVKRVIDNPYQNW